LAYSNAANHPVLLQQPPASQQCFPLTPLQQQPPTTSQPTVFFSHTTPAAASSTSTANRVNKFLIMQVQKHFFLIKAILSSESVV